MKTAKRRRGLQGELDIANEDERLGAVITGCELGVTSEQQWNQVRAVDACDRRLSAQIAHFHRPRARSQHDRLATPCRTRHTHPSDTSIERRQACAEDVELVRPKGGKCNGR